MEVFRQTNVRKSWIQLSLGVLVAIMWLVLSDHFEIVEPDGEFLLGFILFILTLLIIWILSEINFALHSCLGLLSVMAEEQVTELEKQSRESYVKSASAHREFMNKLDKINSVNGETNKTWECLRCGAKMSSTHSTCTNCGTKRA